MAMLGWGGIVMDIEVVEAIESLRTDIGRVETSLRSEIRAEIGKLRAEMVTRGELRGEIGSLREELKRHSEVLFESLRDDIRIVAEGFASISAKIDSFRPPVS